jgi:protease-4
MSRIIKKVFIKIGRGLDIFRRIFINLLFFGIILFLILAPTQRSFIEKPSQAALLLELKGRLVEQREIHAPFDLMTSDESSEASNQEILLSDVLFSLEEAMHDDDIRLVVLSLDQLRGGGTSKISAIGKALELFKSTGKTVIAYGEHFNQAQYQLASYANEIYLDPMGHVQIEGYSTYQLYYRKALDHLKITPHIFRVGQFKSAVEPYMRNSMSAEAKEANQLWLSNLWDNYLKQIATNRNINASQLPLTTPQIMQSLQSFNGDLAQIAQHHKLVDGLMTQSEFYAYINQKLDKPPQAVFPHINLENYLLLNDNPTYVQQGDIAVIIAQGMIMDGNQPPGSIGGDSMAKLLQQALEASHIQSVVIRIDSPGGSAFASEKIRRQVAALKAAGKPVVISMSSLAASGGYWIAMDANYIYATPSTLTGSIGVFSVLPTFEKSLEKIGIKSDGVGTTPWAGLDLTRPLPPSVSAIFQSSVEHIYDNFVQHVARSRNMKLSDVKKVAQGRVWDGKTAQSIGLVDALGDLDNAIDTAAKLANLEHYTVQLIEQELSAEEAFLQMIFKEASGKAFANHVQNWLFNHINLSLQPLKHLAKLNDPNHVYLLCETCLD